jgi:hypothetical protein
MNRLVSVADRLASAADRLVPAITRPGSAREQAAR